MNNETLTKCICHKGFIGYSSIVPRSKFRIGGQDTAPQSLTAHTLYRYGQAEKTHADSILQTENKIVNLQERK